MQDFKYHTSCWVKYVDRGVDESLNVKKHNYNFHEDKMRECIEFDILQRGILRGVCNEQTW